MSGNSLPWQITPTADLTNQEWRFPEGLEYVGGELNENTVLDYFAASPYFDRHSTNEQLRMQTQFSGKPVDDVASELRHFTGIEFAVIHTNRNTKSTATTSANQDTATAADTTTTAATAAAQAAATTTTTTNQAPTLFIIQKRFRENPDTVHPLATYFVVNGSIYQAPDVYSVLSNRLVTIVQRLQNSLDFISSSKPQFNPRRGYDWRVKAEIAPTEEVGSKGASSDDKNNSKSGGENTEQQEQQSKPKTTATNNENMDVDKAEAAVDLNMDQNAENTTSSQTPTKAKTPTKPKESSTNTTSTNSFALAAAFANTLQLYSSASPSTSK